MSHPPYLGHRLNQKEPATDILIIFAARIPDGMRVAKVIQGITVQGDVWHLLNDVQKKARALGANAVIDCTTAGGYKDSLILSGNAVVLEPIKAGE